MNTTPIREVVPELGVEELLDSLNYANLVPQSAIMRLEDMNLAQLLYFALIDSGEHNQ